MCTVTVAWAWNFSRTAYFMPDQFFSIQYPSFVQILKFIFSGKKVTAKYYHFAISL